MVRNAGTIYNVLKTHDKVDEFILELKLAHNDTLKSLYEFWMTRGFLTTKQVQLGVRIINEERRR